MAPTIRTRGGHRRYETTELPGQERKKREPNQRAPIKPPERVAGYIRVSSAKQKDDLDRQREQVEDYATVRGWQMEQVFQDIASGLNDQRPGLRRLLEAGRTGYLDRIIITYDDRLARFGTNLLEWLLTNWGVKLERIQPVQLTSGPEQQLLKDLIALMTSFTGKFHRMRRGKRRSSGQATIPTRLGGRVRRKEVEPETRRERITKSQFTFNDLKTFYRRKVKRILKDRAREKSQSLTPIL